jgi:hypothetical protein
MGSPNYSASETLMSVAVLVFCIWYSFIHPISPAPGTSVDYTTSVIEKPLSLPRSGVIEKPTLGMYQSQLRELRLRLDLTRLHDLNTAMADTLEYLSTEMNQLGFILNPQLASQSISERHAAMLYKRLEHIKDRLEMVEMSLE